MPIKWNFIGFLKNGSSFKEEEEVTLCSFSYPINEREGGQDSVVVIATRYRLDGPGGEIVPVQTCPEAHPASCTVGTWSFPGGLSGRGVVLTTRPLLAPRLKMSWSYMSAICLPAWACHEVNFTVTLSEHE